MSFKCSLVGALAVIASTGGALAQTATPITVVLTDYAFTPSALNLKEGTAYRLHFVNSGSKDHNFNAPEFFAASQIAPQDSTSVKEGGVELGAGQSVDVAVTPGHVGSYAVVCTHFMHKMMGMRGEITVQ